MPNTTQNTQSTIHNQPIIEFNNIDLTLPDQRQLFKNLSLSFTHQTQGLIGRNGTGKSVFTQLIQNFSLACLTYDIKGNVNCHVDNIGFFQQKSNLSPPDKIKIDDSKNQTIADFLEITPVIDALNKIELGDADEALFQIINDQWTIKAEIETKLERAHLPADVDFLVQNLSGGQKTKLTILKLFNSNFEFLVLDEPSNHLDIKGKQWLLELIQQFKFGILLISHDRELLRAVDCIYQLTSNGIELFGGNYDFYFEQNQIQLNALNHQVNHIQKEIKLQNKNQQKQLEQAEQSQKTGIKNKHSRSHSKIAYDTKKESAQSTNRQRTKQTDLLNDDLKTKLDDAKQQISRYDTQALVLDQQNTNGKQVLFIEDLILPYVNKTVNLSLNNNEKLLISGENGSGKSTLLSLIYNSNKYEHIHCNKKVVTLDQHYSLLDQNLNALDNLSIWLTEHSHDNLRTLLANIGLRRDRVFLPCHALSGGEQLKLAWLCVSTQTDCLLLLDEPDNHLDIESKILLQNCLKEYNSCFILVSHDEEFVNAVGITKIINL
ncbi:ATP-binding cassette domain-containing protein [Marinicellulosiphila megalodicopiae]|uniref:ATP-binding cassette domain-containing protein n=1 Tax=Marinicellulosiphila megalodicopiae TaxID=2724896 RepID=UPI003BAF2EE7